MGADARRGDIVGYSCRKNRLIPLTASIATLYTPTPPHLQRRQWLCLTSTSRRHQTTVWGSHGLFTRTGPHRRDGDGATSFKERTELLFARLEGIDRAGVVAHIEYGGVIPESYSHDSSEE